MERRWTRRSLMAAPLATSPFIRQRRALADQSLRFAPGSTIGKTSEGWTDLGEVSTVAAGTTAVARKITLLEPFAGRVYLGYGDFQATSQPGTDVICVDGDDYRTVLPGVKTDALYDARRVADRLWYCVTDPEVGTDPDLVIVDEHHQANVESTPHVVPWHVFDAASFNGYAFLAGARRETDPFNCCCIWRRDSDGQWTAIDGTEGYSTDHRTFGLVVMAGELYALEGTGRVWKSTDGVAWFPASRLGFSDALHKPIPVEGGCLFRRRFPVEGPNDLMRYTGQELAEVVHAGVCDHTLGDDGAVYVLTTDQVLKVSGDGTSFATFVADVPDGACSIAQSDGMTYVGTMDSHIWRFG